MVVWLDRKKVACLAGRKVLMKVDSKVVQWEQSAWRCAGVCFMLIKVKFRMMVRILSE